MATEKVDEERFYSKDTQLFSSKVQIEVINLIWWLIFFQF